MTEVKYREIDKIAWYKENSEGRTHEVGKRNKTRGGCLVTNRRRSHPTFGIEDLGFRLAKSF